MSQETILIGEGKLYGSSILVSSAGERLRIEAQPGLSRWKLGNYRVNHFSGYEPVCLKERGFDAKRSR